MATIVAVYTGRGLEGLILSLFAEHLPEHRLVNIIDDGIIHEVNREGYVSKAVIRRILTYYKSAVDIGADIILNTCSSVGEVTDIGRQLIDVPILRIDEPMAIKAITEFSRIGVIATLPSTLKPTARLLSTQAGLVKKEVNIVEGLAEGAYNALIGGRPEEHDALIIKAAEKLGSQTDCIVLAQGSMGRMQQKLQEITGKVVLSSPVLCMEHLKTLLGGQLK